MLSDLIGAVATYLHDVSSFNSAGGLRSVFGAGHVLHAVAVQWIASERVARSVVPSFWVFSILGGLLLFIYALQRKDPVFIAGRVWACSSTCAICNSSCADAGLRPG